MLSNAIEFVKKQVEEFLSYKGGITQSVLQLSTLSGTDDSEKSGDRSDVINMSIVNIEEEESMANRLSYTERGGVFEKKNPPVYLNIYLLFSMSFKSSQYLEGLHWLSLIIQFFQQNKSFSAENTPMPKGIEKLNFELENLEIDNMSRFWGALGANYQPSVIYKMRMITIDGEAVEAKMSGIHEPEINTETNL